MTKHLLWLLPAMLGAFILYVNQGGSGPVFLGIFLFMLSILAALFIKFDVPEHILEYFE